jgi:multiple sugar transport system permease protein
MGYASALAWILLAIVGGLTAINFAVSRYWVFYESEGGGSK